MSKESGNKLCTSQKAGNRSLSLHYCRKNDILISVIVLNLIMRV